jgi:hypothetical protein
MKMNWISVKDKLPENIEDMCEHDYVLFLSTAMKNHGSPGNIYSIAQRREGKWDFPFGNRGVFSCEDEWDIESDDITHWMPFPVVPLTKEN